MKSPFHNELGTERYHECRTHGLGTANKLGRILLLGFDQREAATNHLLSKAMRKKCESKTPTDMLVIDLIHGLHRHGLHRTRDLLLPRLRSGQMELAGK